MRRMIEKIIAQYGTDMTLTSGGKTKTVRAFFRAVNAKSWQNMESEATLLGEISRGEYAYIGPVGAQVREGDTLTLGIRRICSGGRSFITTAISRSTSGGCAWRRV